MTRVIILTSFPFLLEIPKNDDPRKRKSTFNYSDQQVPLIYCSSTVCGRSHLGTNPPKNEYLKTVNAPLNFLFVGRLSSGGFYPVTSLCNPHNSLINMRVGIVYPKVKIYHVQKKQSLSNMTVTPKREAMCADCHAVTTQLGLNPSMMYILSFLLHSSFILTGVLDLFLISSSGVCSRCRFVSPVCKTVITLYLIYCLRCVPMTKAIACSFVDVRSMFLSRQHAIIASPFGVVCDILSSIAPMNSMVTLRSTLEHPVLILIFCPSLFKGMDLCNDNENKGKSRIKYSRGKFKQEYFGVPYFIRTCCIKKKHLLNCLRFLTGEYTEVRRLKMIPQLGKPPAYPRGGDKIITESFCCYYNLYTRVIQPSFNEYLSGACCKLQAAELVFLQCWYQGLFWGSLIPCSPGHTCRVFLGERLEGEECPPQS
ncbi:hypothetical protein VP01_3901g1 [Puccinia sorghi]|uniref:Uncharacterized protein n=1 Tax=Puccinia sorghi TaxID=27349 RepID=A0A0L6USP1_9BASI|nr:hypothetical protein VP01_3901g1 [Puccinia sorghi]